MKNSEISYSKIKKDLKRALKEIDPDLLDEFLEGLEDEDDLLISIYDLETLFEKGEGYYPLLGNLILFAVSNCEYSTDDLLTIIGLIDKTKNESAKAKILQKAVSEAITTYDYKSLVDYCIETKAETNIIDKYYQQAKNSISDIADCKHLLDCKNSSLETYIFVSDILKKNIIDESFFLSYGTDPIDIYKTALKKSFIDDQTFVSSIKDLCDIEGNKLPYLSMLRGLHDKKKYSKLFVIVLDNAVEQIQSANEKYNLYTYINDDLKDEKRADLYYSDNKIDIDLIISEREKEKEEEKHLDQICQCAVLVSGGDGFISHEEVFENDCVRPIIEGFLKNKEAILELEKTNDFESAKKLHVEHRGFAIHSAFSHHEYVQEVLDNFSEASTAEELTALIKLYATKITDVFDQRMTAWAAKEVASIDGLDDNEMFALKIMADVWGLDLKENDRYFSSYVYPIMLDKFEYTGPPLSDKEVIASARIIDEHVANNPDDSLSQSLSEQLGVNSIEDLLQKLYEIEDDDEKRVEDTSKEDLPDIFKPIMLEGDWDKVISSAANGADINEHINYYGIEGLSILALAAEQAPLEHIKALVKYGADINHKQLNIDLPSGYNCPLVASLKGSGRIDVFDFLIESGADPDPFNFKESGWTPLTIAANNGIYEAIKTLLNLGARPNCPDSEGRTAYKQLGNQHSDTALYTYRLLLEHGANACHVDNEGFAAIHNAVGDAPVEVIKMHIEEGNVPIDFPIKSYKGYLPHTPLLRAMLMGNLDVVDYLVSKGANVNSINENHSIFRSIISAASESRIENPLEQIQRFLKLGAIPRINDISMIFKFLSEISNVSNNVDPWYLETVKLFLDSDSIDISNLDESDKKYLEENINKALEKSSSEVEKIFELLNSYNIDLEALLSL